MSTTKALYGSDTAITITLTSLADQAARESTAIVNTSDLFLDALLYVAVKLAAGTPTGDKSIDVYVYASEDGTNYDDNVTGADAAVTLRTPTNLTLLGSIETPDSGALTYRKVFPSVAKAFGGILPPKWGVVVFNDTGVAVDSSGNSVKYRGLHAQAT